MSSTVFSHILEQAEANLTKSVLPFWAGHACDLEHGGFLTRLDRQGGRLEDQEKILIMQVRMIWSLAAAHRFGMTGRGYLDKARRGFGFLQEHFWDPAQGGFYFSTTRDGTPLSRRKTTDFHAYAITGLTEYYRASQDSAALELAEQALEVLLLEARDGALGFIEDFDGGAWPVLNSEQMHLGGQQRLKTIDMHTNMLEAVMYLARVTGAPEHLEVLRDLLELISAHGIHREHGCTITAFDYEWSPIADGAGRMTTSYGINVELAWLMMAAVEVLGAEREPYQQQALRLIDHALEFGFDWERGGLAAYGPLTGSVVDAAELPEDRLVRAWWEQAELLIALLEAHRWTGSERYLEAFEKLWGWIWKHQIDHECGDWYQEVAWPSGAPLILDKGGEWKTAFHTSRALIHVCERLREIRLHR